jgi:hypothetical protein
MELRGPAPRMSWIVSNPWTSLCSAVYSIPQYRANIPISTPIVLLLTQYFDCIRDVGSAGHCKTTFVPSGKMGGAGGDIRNQLLVADAAKLS